MLGVDRSLLVKEPILRILPTEGQHLFYQHLKQCSEAGESKKLFIEAPVGIALIDSLTGHIYEVNPMFAKIAGRTIEEMVQIDWMTAHALRDEKERFQSEGFDGYLSKPMEQQELIDEMKRVMSL